MKIPDRYRIIGILLSFIALYFIQGIPGQTMVFCGFFLLSCLSRQRKQILGFFTPLLIFSLITLLIHLFMRFDTQSYWQAFSTAALWQKAGYFTLRNTNILLMMSYLLKSLPDLSYQDMIRGVETHVSPRYAQPLSIALYYSALLQDEFRSLQQVHRILGIHRPVSPAARSKYYISLILPTIIGSLEKAENLSIAMTSRGYNLTERS